MTQILHRCFCQMSVEKSGEDRARKASHNRTYLIVSLALLRPSSRTKSTGPTCESVLQSLIFHDGNRLLVIDNEFLEILIKTDSCPSKEKLKLRLKKSITTFNVYFSASINIFSFSAFFFFSNGFKMNPIIITREVNTIT